VGIAAIVGGPAPVNVQMLTDAALLLLNVRTLQLRGQSERDLNLRIVRSRWRVGW